MSREPGVLLHYESASALEFVFLKNDTNSEIPGSLLKNCWTLEGLLFSPSNISRVGWATKSTKFIPTAPFTTVNSS